MKKIFLSILGLLLLMGSQAFVNIVILHRHVNIAIVALYTFVYMSYIFIAVKKLLN